MAAIAINDLPISRALDVKAISSVRGALGNFGQWVNGWCTPWTPPVPFLPPFPEVFNFYQVNIGQVIDQSQTVNILNSGANSSNSAFLLSAGNAANNLKA